MLFYLKNKKKLFREIVFFISAGITANVISFIAYMCGMYFFSLRGGLSAFLGQIFALTANYLINSKLSFKYSLSFNGKFKYIIYYSLSIFLVSIAIELLNSNGVDQKISWLICVSIFSVINFLFLKFFVFIRKWLHNCFPFLYILIFTTNSI